MRKITLENGDVWEYKVGEGTVVFRSPQRKRFPVFLSDLFGGIDVERARHKRTLHVTPAKIKDYIKKNLVK